MTMNRRVVAACAILSLAGCGGGSDSPLPSDPAAPAVGLLSPVADRSAFETAIKQSLSATTDNEVLVAADAARDASFTGTYTQELNVDELDGVRYDGELLLVAPRRFAHCCFILETDGFAPQEPPAEGSIRILATDADSASAALVSEIPLASGTSVQGMYLQDERLFALTAHNYYGSYGMRWADAAIWAPEKLGFEVFDLADPANPELKTEATIDGVYVTSRRIGNTVYVVSRYTPWIEGLNYYITTAEQQTQNQALLDTTTLEDLLPQISINGETSLLVQPENCYVTTGDEASGYPVLTSVTAIPIDDPANFTTACYNESAYGVYVSPTSLYLTELRPDSQQQQDRTRVHKFALGGTRISYRGSADFGGTVWQGNQADFRLSEHNGYLRVLASQFDWSNADFVDHQLFVLREAAATPDLEIVATLPNTEHPEEIGKPNETLFGVRFLDDRAYAVTFERIDPLYVIDLTDPQDPYLAGELTVAGVSEFLHPVSDELLLGVGRSVAGGIKLELFDASDITRPQSRGGVDIGGAGSYTEVFQDRHAFTYQANAGGVDRFTIPASVYATDGSYQFLGNQLHLFEIRDKTTPAQATVQAIATVEARPGEGPTWVERNRTFIHDDTVFYVQDETVWSFFWNSPYVVNGPY